MTNYSRPRFLLLGMLLAVAVGGIPHGAGAANPSAPLPALQLMGVVRSADPVYVTASVQGAIASVRVDVGDVVKAGDVLVELESSRYQLEVQRAEANVEVARARLNALKAGARPEDLQNSPARERVAVAEAELRLAQAELQLARHDLDATQIRAPGDGTILSRRAVVGQVVTPGSSEALLELANLNALSVSARVPESMMGNVPIGRACRVQVGATPNTVYQGQVATVRPSVDSRTGNFPIQVQIAPSQDSSQLRPGMSANVMFDAIK